MSTTEDILTCRLAHQHLLAKAPKLTVVRDLCGIQAQFFPNVVYALRLHASDFDENTLAAGLVKKRTIRGTVHIFAESDLSLFLLCRNGTDYRSEVCLLA